jgi:hypothetical protein
MRPAEISHGWAFQREPFGIRYRKGFEKNLQQILKEGQNKIVIHNQFTSSIVVRKAMNLFPHLANAFSLSVGAYFCRYSSK